MSSRDVFAFRAHPAPRSVLVQGASRGIGLEIARQLLESPGVDRVHATCRAPERSTDLMSLAESHGDRLRFTALDVTDEASVEAAARDVGATTRRLDLIINCAGLLHEPAGMQPERRLADVRPENLVQSFRVNALGPLLVAKHFQDFLDRNDRAVFASLSARVGSIGDNRLGGWYAYRASKAAQNMVTRNLAIELRRRAQGIVCVALHPGTVATDLSAPFRGRVPAEKLFDVERAARQLLAVIDGLAPESNGGFFAWDGKPIPW